MTEAFQRKCARCSGTGVVKDVGLVPITCPVCGGKGWNRMR